MMNPVCCGLLFGLCSCGRTNTTDALNFYKEQERQIADQVDKHICIQCFVLFGYESGSKIYICWYKGKRTREGKREEGGKRSPDFLPYQLETCIFSSTLLWILLTFLLDGWSPCPHFLWNGGDVIVARLAQVEVVLDHSNCPEILTLSQSSVCRRSPSLSYIKNLHFSKSLSYTYMYYL